MLQKIKRYQTSAQLQELFDQEIEKFKTHFPSWCKQRAALLQYTFKPVELDPSKDYTLSAQHYLNLGGRNITVGLTPVENEQPKSAKEHSAHIQKQIQAAAFGVEFINPNPLAKILLNTIEQMQDEPSLQADWAAVQAQYPHASQATQTRELARRLCGEVAASTAHKNKHALHLSKVFNPQAQQTPINKQDLIEALEFLATNQTHHNASGPIPLVQHKKLFASRTNHAAHQVPQGARNARVANWLDTTTTPLSEKFDQEVQRFKTDFPSWHATRGKHCSYQLAPPEAGFDATQNWAFNAEASMHGAHMGQTLTPVNTDPTEHLDYTQANMKHAALVLEYFPLRASTKLEQADHPVFTNILAMLQTQHSTWGQIAAQGSQALEKSFPEKTPHERALRWFISQVQPNSATSTASTATGLKTLHKMLNNQDLMCADLSVAEAKKCLSYLLNNADRHAQAGPIPTPAMFQQFTQALWGKSLYAQHQFSQAFASWQKIRMQGQPFPIENSWETAARPFNYEAPWYLQPTLTKEKAITWRPVNGVFRTPQEQSNYVQNQLTNLVVALEFSDTEQAREPNKRNLLEKMGLLFRKKTLASDDLTADRHAVWQALKTQYNPEQMHEGNTAFTRQAALQLLQKVAQQTPTPAPGELLLPQWTQRRNAALQTLCATPEAANNVGMHETNPGLNKETLQTLLTLYLHDPAQHQTQGPLIASARPRPALQAHSIAQSSANTWRQAPTHSRSPSPPLSMGH